MGHTWSIQISETITKLSFYANSDLILKKTNTVTSYDDGIK